MKRYSIILVLIFILSGCIFFMSPEEKEQYWARINRRNSATEFLDGLPYNNAQYIAQTNTISLYYNKDEMIIYAKNYLYDDKESGFKSGASVYSVNYITISGDTSIDSMDMKTVFDMNKNSMPMNYRENGYKFIEEKNVVFNDVKYKSFSFEYYPNRDAYISTMYIAPCKDGNFIQARISFPKDKLTLGNKVKTSFMKEFSRHYKNSGVCL